MEYFSERELGKKYDNEEIDYRVYNGILAIYRKYINFFAIEFPIKCKNCDEIIDIDEVVLEKTIEAQIPNFNLKYKNDSEFINEKEKYAVLDFLEFCHKYMWEGSKTYTNNTIKDKCKIHNNHFYYGSKKRAEKKFRKDINRILEINNSVFFLDKDGKVKRRLPLEMNRLINNINLNTSDIKLNELIGLAINNVQKPNLIDRKIGLEKIWDAFERMKTYYENKNKKSSLEQILTDVGQDTDKFYELLNNEFKELTRIGNEYQIRHFEKDKIEIKSAKHIDYLFYRMLNSINVCVSILK